MPVEVFSFITSLNSTNPVGATDVVGQGDDHIRGIKAVLLATFANLNGAVLCTPAQLNRLNSIAALAVLANATNGAAEPTAIAAGADHQVLRRSGAALAFGALDLSQAAAVVNRLALANLATLAGVSVLGRSANSVGEQAAITAAANDRLLRRVADALDFGQLTAGMFPAAVVPDAALSANVDLLNGAQTVTGQKNFSTRPKTTGEGGFLSHGAAGDTGGKVTVSTLDPSGVPGNGDIWIKYTP